MFDQIDEWLKAWVQEAGFDPPESIRLGRVIIDIGIAPVLPTEFVIFRISQYEAGAEVKLT